MDIITGINFLQGATSSTRIKGLKDCDGTENWKYRGLKLFFSCRGVFISPSGPQVTLVLPVILVGGEPSAKRAPTLTILGLYFWLIKVSDGGDQKKATVAPTSSRQWPPSTDTHWARRSRVAPWNIMLREMMRGAATWVARRVQGWYGGDWGVYWGTCNNVLPRSCGSPRRRGGSHSLKPSWSRSVNAPFGLLVYFSVICDL